MAENSKLKLIDINEWQEYVLKYMGVTVEEAGDAMTRLMQGMSKASDRTEAWRELTSVDERKTGNKRNGALDRREAFGSMLKLNRKGW